mmetsp:Transcript_45025/g.97785  ORF Transcript_45025/g.97785 Transcript_45025/m.97785 type:complete len:182 (+) Transcript_45025:35-580(+)|eukprot:CAMPEP_0170578640 /NCGR_PEP_ID=MMETSP0224-20130122/5563_1 /TAXON_ID=285029 /ORGANISM="Togula jolla, Strain CCCM 725" /LENGTH=181 /DNA_ID=CAMNT_0010901621 /DNA_START=35 /DNA_END=580 /DNA_ORIENTATION=+
MAKSSGTNGRDAVRLVNLCAHAVRTLSGIQLAFWAVTFLLSCVTGTVTYILIVITPVSNLILNSLTAYFASTMCLRQEKWGKARDVLLAAAVLSISSVICYVIGLALDGLVYLVTGIPLARASFASQSVWQNVLEERHTFTGISITFNVIMVVLLILLTGLSLRARDKLLDEEGLEPIIVP